MNIRRILLVVLVIGALLGGVVYLLHSQQSGTLKLVLKLPDSDNLSVKLDDKPFTVAGLANTYPLGVGHHTLTLARPGYQTATIGFDIASHNETLLNVALKRSTTPSLQSWQQVSDADHYAMGASITQTVYFYDQTWAFLKISAYGTDTAVVVVRYDDLNTAWRVALGPGTLFTHQSLQITPKDVENYMTQNGYADDGGLR